MTQVVIDWGWYYRIGREREMGGRSGIPANSSDRSSHMWTIFGEMSAAFVRPLRSWATVMLENITLWEKCCDPLQPWQNQSFERQSQMWCQQNLLHALLCSPVQAPEVVLRSSFLKFADVAGTRVGFSSVSENSFHLEKSHLKKQFVRKNVTFCKCKLNIFYTSVCVCVCVCVCVFVWFKETYLVVPADSVVSGSTDRLRFLSPKTDVLEI